MTADDSMTGQGGGFQNPGICLQAFPSFPSPSPHFHFLALVSFLARSKLRIPFLGLYLLRNRTETLATQAIKTVGSHLNACAKFIISHMRLGCCYDSVFLSEKQHSFKGVPFFFHQEYRKVTK